MIKILNLTVASRISVHFNLIKLFFDFVPVCYISLNHLWLGSVNKQLHPANLILVMNAVNTDHLELLSMSVLLDGAVLHLEKAYEVNHILILRRLVAILTYLAE